MGRISNTLKSVFSRSREIRPENAEDLRRDFRARYHHFKLLLNANNKALESMTEMQEALKGARPFGMSFVFSRCTSVATNVWQIVKNLNELAPGKYEELFTGFKDIQVKINPYISRPDFKGEGPLVIPLQDIDASLADRVGGKMANMGEVGNRLKLKTPGGFAVTAHAYHRFMDHNDLSPEIYRLIQTADVSRLDRLYALSSRIQQRVIDAALPGDLEKAIMDHYERLQDRTGKGIRVAMRSSALGEDFMETSFAGQYRSLLNVSGEYIPQVYKEIVASKYGPPAMMYRLRRGIRDEDVPMCVGCVAMVDAVSSGVMYSRNPVNERDDRIIINAVWGLPKPVVDGSTATDLFILSREKPLNIEQKQIALKDQKFVCYPGEGVCRTDITGDLRKMPSLMDRQVLDLAALALKLETHYGMPQDIEWALDETGDIVILQCRPLQQTTARRIPDSHNKGPSVDAPLLLEGGFTASPGAGTGLVFTVRKEADALRFPEGGVLVADQALPRWATLLGRAAAVVTERGSVAGHLANVAREFGVPAIFGLTEAVERLKPGRQITVDADGGRIYQGAVDELLEERVEAKNIMIGSPVHQSLEGAGRHIIPLNLLDPDAPSFKPKHCKTFHDITRFCHEKSVQEMFNFGREHHFPERSGKQLYDNRPMQWWVLNLDDGFEREVDGKYVELSNITSIPMLSIWEGIVFKPWEGPPTMDRKGFVSVMFQATTNPALATGVRSSYGNRNYFMISRNFCSLSCRFGFHFTTVEALVSERSGENYISFQFKGGAADFNRKLKRVLFIQEILEAYGFRTEIKEDNLTARMEDRDTAFMKKRLMLIGYLLIHTRQLDMVMENNASVMHFRSGITVHINELMETDMVDRKTIA
ncbi:MAG: pyruvate, water dikinase [Deltaproteobacteria bacterium]|nr:pyruvate, water dikinase [Deltaproteobacteria bacterium]